MELSTCVNIIVENVRKEIMDYYPESIIDYVIFDYDDKSVVTGFVKGIVQIHFLEDFVVGPEYVDSYLLFPFESFKSHIPFCSAVAELRQNVAKYMDMIELKGYLLSKELVGESKVQDRMSEAMYYLSKLLDCDCEEIPLSRQNKNLANLFMYDYYENYGEVLDDIERYFNKTGRLPESNSYLYMLYDYMKWSGCLNPEETARFWKFRNIAIGKHIDGLLDKVESFCKLNDRWYEKGEGGDALFWLSTYNRRGMTSKEQLTRMNNLYTRYVKTQSAAETAVVTYLRSKGYIVRVQYEFRDCVYKVPLPFDVAFWVGGRLCLVECNGLQHYEPVEYFGGEKAFKERKLKDSIKRKYCKENNIPLLEIPYTVGMTEIPAKLDEFIDEVFKSELR